MVWTRTEERRRVRVWDGGKEGFMNAVKELRDDHAERADMKTHFLL